MARRDTSFVMARAYMRKKWRDADRWAEGPILCNTELAALLRRARRASNAPIRRAIGVIESKALRL